MPELVCLAARYFRFKSSNTTHHNINCVKFMTLSLLSTSLKTFDFRMEPEALDDNISFSRETEASYFGADGYLRFAQPGQNLLTQSQDFADSVWTRQGV